MVKLTQVADIVNESVCEYEGVKSYIATGDVDCDHVVSFTEVGFKDKPSRANIAVQSGDVIVARMKDTIKVLEIDDALSDNIYSTGFAVFRPKPNKITSSLLKHFLLSGEFQRQKNKHSTGATQKAVPNSGLQKVIIENLPKSLDEQRRIARILDKADELRKRRQESLNSLDDLLRFTFLDMFGDPVKNTKNLPQKNIASVGKVYTGNTPSRARSNYYGSHIEWIKSDNINTPHHYLTPAEEFLSEEGEKVGRTVPENSILVTCIAGSKSCIGNIAMADRKVAFNQQINAIVPDKKKINYYFLYAQLYTSKELIQSASTNSMKGMVNKSKFEAIKILCPEKGQEEFSLFFEKYLYQEQQSRKAFLESEKLYNALTQRAFKGEL